MSFSIAELHALLSEAKAPEDLVDVRAELSRIAARSTADVRDLLTEAIAAIDAFVTGPHERAPAAREHALKCVFDASQAAREGLVRVDANAELLGDFLVEAREHVTTAEAGLLTLERSPADVEAIGTVFRAFHTVKGGAAMVDLPVIVEITHDIESLLTPVREGKRPFDDVCASLSLRVVDVLKELFDVIQTAGPGGSFAPSTALAALLVDLSATQGVDHGPKGPAGMLFYTQMPPVMPVLSMLAAARRASVFAPPHAPPLPKVETPNAPVDPLAAAPPAPLPPQAAAPPAAAEHTETRTEAADPFVRIRTQRLDRLIDLVGEIVIAQSMVAQDGTLLSAQAVEMLKKVMRLDKLTRELQDFSMSLRMVPLKSTFQRMSRVVRDTARKSGHEAELVTFGDDTEIDRNMVDVLADPLIHMVRNAVDHGIESPETRVAAGKRRAGTIHLRAFQQGGSVVVELSDDGAGLDRQKLAQKAIAKGIIVTDAGMSESDVFALIFEPGFSTKEEVTDISGRGVGMDVVRRSIQEIRGKITITSQVGKGTTFRLYLPLTLAITDGMLVRVADERFIIPTANIQLAMRPDPSALSALANHGELLVLRGEAVPLLRLGSILGVLGGVSEASRGVVVIVSDRESSYGLLVDEILGQQHVVAKPLTSMTAIRGISEGAILGDGRVGLILDTAALGALAREGGFAVSAA